MSVGVMKDYKLKLRNLRASHTLGCLLLINKTRAKDKGWSRKNNNLTFNFRVVYYESIKRKPKIRGIYEFRCDERLQTKSKEFTHLAYTGLVLELEHLKIETRLINESFANAMGECEN